MVKLVLRNNKKSMLVRWALGIFIILAVTAVVCSVTFSYGSKKTLESQKESSLQVLDYISTVYDSNLREADEMIAFFHNGNTETLSSLSEFFPSDQYNAFYELSMDEQMEKLLEIKNLANADAFYIIDPDGEIVLAPVADMIGIHLPEDCGWNLDELNELLTGEPVFSNLYDCCYYAAPITIQFNQYYVVLGEKSSLLLEQFNSITDINRLVRSVSTSGDSTILALDTVNQSFASCTIDGIDYSGETYTDSNLPNDIFRNGEACEIIFEQTEYYCVSKECTGKMFLVYIYDKQALEHDEMEKTNWLGIIILAGGMVALYYAYAQRCDLVYKNIKCKLLTTIKRKKGNNIVSNQNVLAKLVPFATLIVVLTFVCNFYVYTLFGLSTIVSTSKSIMNRVQKNLDNTTALSKEIGDYYEERYLGQVRLLCTQLEVNPEPLNGTDRRTYSAYDENGNRITLTDEEGNLLQCAANSQKLSQYCENNNLDVFHVYNSQGYVIATSGEDWSYQLSRDSGDPSYPFLQVLDGRKDYLIQEKEADENGEPSKYIAVHFHYYTTVDENGDTLYVSQDDYNSYLASTWDGEPVHAHDSMIQVSVSEDVFHSYQASAVMEKGMRNGSVFSEGYVLALDKNDSHTILYSPTETEIGKSATEVGLSDACFEDNYNGFKTIGGNSCFVCCRDCGDFYLCTVVKVEMMYGSRLAIAINAALAALIVETAVMILYVLATEREENNLSRLAEEMDMERKRLHNCSLYREKNKGKIKYVPEEDESASYMIKTFRSFRRSSPEQKLMAAASLLGLFLIAYLAIYLNNVANNPSEESILTYIINGDWERTLSIFSLTASIGIMGGLAILSTMLRNLVVLMFGVMGRKGETMGRLFASVIKYIAMIWGLFHCLVLCGMSPTSLLGTAGVMSVIIGLGSQSLISDILAGVFIVFEGDFHVGDFVTIDNFTGEVSEIGLRTTKLVEDGTHDVKIYNNSKISGAVNKTYWNSWAKCKVSISYNEPIERIEKIMEKELPRMKEKIPDLLGEPVYDGIQELGTNAVSIELKAECFEKRRSAVQKKMRRELLIILKKYDIEVPYQQVVVYEPKPTLDWKQAEAYNEESHVFVDGKELHAHTIRKTDYKV